MIVERNEHLDPDGSVGWMECIYDSSNILLSTYFPKTQLLYIHFGKGSGYSYSNVDQELYNRFETSESQGKFFVSEIKNNPKHPHAKEYKLFEGEIERAKQVVDEWKKNQQSLNS